MLLFQQIEDLAYKHTDARRTIGEFLLAKKSRIKAPIIAITGMGENLLWPRSMSAFA